MQKSLYIFTHMICLPFIQINKTKFTNYQNIFFLNNKRLKEKMRLAEDVIAMTPFH